METGRYEIRKMTRAEVDFAIGLAAEEGWNPGIHDAECFYAADPNGFFIGLLNGELISTVSAVMYGEVYGFLGLYVVKPEYRSEGYGTKIGMEALNYLGNRCVGLDGVLARQETYAQHGFKFAHYNRRYKGFAIGGGQSGKLDSNIVDLSEIPFEVLNAYDEDLFQAPRSEFLRSWINQPDGISLGIVADGRLSGYTVLRKCAEGNKVGPLFADREDLAEALFHELSCRLPEGTPMFLDVPGEAQNPAATRLAMRHGMNVVFETARMYRTQNAAEIHLPLERWFGITTFELG
jgi:GNAT superfamily N-acetyltransferase